MSLLIHQELSICVWYVPVCSHGLQQVDVCGPRPLLSIHRSSFRPGWSGVLAEEVGGEFQPKAPGIGSKSVEEGEEVLGAEDSVSQCEAQGRGDDTPAILHHPCVWPPSTAVCLTRPVHHCLPWGDREQPPEDPGPATPLPWPPPPLAYRLSRGREWTEQLPGKEKLTSLVWLGKG